MSKMSFAAQTNGWELLAATVLKHAEELPGTAAYRADLVKALEDARQSRSEHLQLRSETLQAAQRMREAIVRGEDAERRLRRLLQAIHGATDSKLLRYGIQPHRERRRPTDEAEVPEAAAPDAPGEPAAGEAEASEAPPAPKPRGRRSRR